MKIFNYIPKADIIDIINVLCHENILMYIKVDMLDDYVYF